MAGVLSYSLELDAAGLTSAIGSAQASLSGLQQRMDTIGSGAGIFDGQSRSAITAAAGFKQAGASTQSLTTKLSDAGLKAANIVAGAKAVGTAWRASSRFFQSGGISGALTRVRSGLRSIATDPGMRRLAIAAGAATVAIGGTYAAIRTLRAGAAGIGSASNGIRSLGTAARSASGGISGLAGKLTSLPALLAGGAAGAGVLGVAFKSFKAAADMESTTVSIRTMVGDIQRADTLIANLKKMGASTPFEFTELASAGKSLVAFGVAAENVVPQLRDIGDVASGLNIPIGELSEIFGKAKVQGTLFAEDIAQMAGRGVPIFSALAGAIGKNENEIKDLASEGKITFPMLEQAFRNLTAEGGQFHGMMQKQSLTTNGLLSTLKSDIHEIFITLGQPLNDMMKPVITGWIEKAKTFGIQLQGIIGLLREASAQGRLGEVIGTGLQLAAVKFINKFSGGIRGAVAFLGSALPDILVMLGDTLFNPKALMAIRFVFAAAGKSIEAAGWKAGAAIAESLDAAIPDWLRERWGGIDSTYSNSSATLAAGSADAMMETALDLWQSQDFAGMGAKIGAGLQTIMADAGKEWSAAASKDLIDEKGFKDAFTKIGTGLDPFAMAQVLDPGQFIPKDTPGKRGPVVGLQTALQELNGTIKKAEENNAGGGRAPGLLAAAGNAMDANGLGPDGKPTRAMVRQLKRDLRPRRFINKERQAEANKKRQEAIDTINRIRGITPKQALEAADRAARAADPRQGRGAAAADPQQKALDAMLGVVTEIKTTFATLATA